VADKIDKVIVTNLGALKAKYGAKGVTAITKAIDALIAADKQRGLRTQLIGIDVASEMKKLAAPLVKKANNRKQNKAAIDGIYRSLAPDYLLLLGAIDVIPHQDPTNPLYLPSGPDQDQFAFGDLPYACEAAYSQRPEDFVGPTRVVGRLPDVTGGQDPTYLITLLKTAAGYKPIDHDQFTNYFAITAEIWKSSTKLSLTNTFGNNKALRNVPHEKPSWAAKLLKSPVHFFNCHGAIGDARFFGQPASGKEDFPVAHDAAYVDGKLLEGVIAAAECCYGGELYGLSATQTQLSLCNTYLANKSYGFFGSTTIAYGPSTGNGQADLICQYFLQNLLEGSSLGRAVLEARQKFVRTASPPDPADLKTLMQFNLYGDPSITPVPVALAAVPPASTKSAVPMMMAARAERQDRRRTLFSAGINLANTEPVTQRTQTPTPKPMINALRAQARVLGIEPAQTLSFTIQYPPSPKSMPQLLASASTAMKPTAYNVVFGAPKSLPIAQIATKAVFQQADPQPNISLIVALIGKEVDGELVSVSEIHSR
jgi:hypothetical protein